MIRNKFAILTLFIASSSYATPPPGPERNLRLQYTCLSIYPGTKVDGELKSGLRETMVSGSINISSQFKLAGQLAVHTIFSKKDDHIILTETLSNEEECSKYPTTIKWIKNPSKNYKSTFCLPKVEVTPDSTRGSIRKNSSTTPVIVSLEAPKEISEESIVFNGLYSISSCQSGRNGNPLTLGEQLILGGFVWIPPPWK